MRVQREWEGKNAVGSERKRSRKEGKYGGDRKRSKKTSVEDRGNGEQRGKEERVKCSRDSKT